MDAKEFEKGLKDSLDKLTPEQIEKIHNDFNFGPDYSISDNPDQEITADNGDTWMEFEALFKKISIGAGSMQTTI